MLRTSIIAGLPGEGEPEFEELCAFLREAKIERAGVFPYSPEEGTPAARIKEGKVPEKTKEHRMDVIMKNQMSIHEKNNQKFVGKTL